VAGVEENGVQRFRPCKSVNVIIVWSATTLVTAYMTQLYMNPKLNPSFTSLI
jgi:hypothetical protein